MSQLVTIKVCLINLHTSNVLKATTVKKEALITLIKYALLVIIVLLKLLTMHQILVLSEPSNLSKGKKNVLIAIQVSSVAVKV